VPLSTFRRATDLQAGTGRYQREVVPPAAGCTGKEDCLRSATSLIQTAGRAARHLNGEVILNADVKTQSIQKFLAVTEYRRQKQIAYNQEHGITPRSAVRAIEQSLSTDASYKQQAAANFDVTETIRVLEEEMLTAANNLEFEKAALLRDQIRELKRQFGQATDPAKAPSEKAATAVSYRKGKRRK
jgi:excinuclease ABC subunit B